MAGMVGHYKFAIDLLLNTFCYKIFVKNAQSQLLLCNIGIFE